MFKKYPFVKQNGFKDCAAASLLMIIKYYDGYINLDQLSDMLETNKNGTTAYNIVKVASSIGFKAKGIKTNLNEVNSENLILPCIAHVTLEEKYQHYIVIYKIDFKNKYLIIGDPQAKIKKISFESFKKIWNEILIVLYPTSPIPRNYNNSLSGYLFEILKKYKKDIIQLVLISIVLTTFSIISSFYFKFIIDKSLYPKQYIVAIFFFFMTMYVLKIITEFFRTKLLIFLNQKLELDINFNSFKQVVSLPYHYYRNRTTGEIISCVNNLDIVREMISKVALSIFIDLPLSFVCLLILYFINTKLFFITIINLILYIIIILIFKKVLNQSIQHTQEAKAQVNSYMVESLNGFETIKGLRIIKYINKNYENKYVKYLKSIFSLQNIYANQIFLKDLINTLGQAIVIFVGVLLVIKGELTLGTLLTFNTVLALFIEPIKNAIDLDYMIKEAKISLKRVLDMFSKTEEKGIIIKDVKGNININNLCLELNNKNILNSISLNIKEGNKVMIVGASGAGKSTFLKVLMKYYEVNRGSILINGEDYNDYKSSDGINYISQQETLFTDTIYNNIILDNNDVTEFLKVAKLCKVDEIIKQNNLGYNTLIEENGFNISGGQKQRIVLARAIMKKFNILLIDEGLNQMDINLERQILKNIFNEYSNKTIIIISHRIENMDLYDQIIEFNQGKIMKEVTKNGAY